MFKGHGVGVAFGEGYVTVDCRGVYVYGCSEGAVEGDRAVFCTSSSGRKVNGTFDGRTGRGAIRDDVA